jgi:hypothetical protein
MQPHKILKKNRLASIAKKKEICFTLSKITIFFSFAFRFNLVGLAQVVATFC